MRESRARAILSLLLRAFCLRVQREVGWAIRIVGNGGGGVLKCRPLVLGLGLPEQTLLEWDNQSNGEPRRCHLLAALWIAAVSSDKESRTRESFRGLRLMCAFDLEEVVNRPACAAASRSVDGRPAAGRSLPKTKSRGIPAPRVFFSLSIFFFCCPLGERREAKSGASERAIGDVVEGEDERKGSDGLCARPSLGDGTDAKSVPLTASRGAFLSSNQESLFVLAVSFVFEALKETPLSVECPLDELLIEEKEEERRRTEVVVGIEDGMISQEPRFARDLVVGSEIEMGPSHG